MSGTSMDGLDMVCCRFLKEKNSLKYELLQAETLPYTSGWTEDLNHCMNLSATELLALDVAYGSFVGKSIYDFLQKNNLKADLVASHGHTVHHRPDLGYSMQIGHGAHLWQACGIPVVNDFRIIDVAAGGQGAPLVPMGDALLFSDYDQCINLGGIANISFTQNEERLAYDISPFNLVLNALAAREGKPFDAGGLLASEGAIIPALLNLLNHLDYYHLSGPKSLGKEWLVKNIFSLFQDTRIHTRDYLRTFIEHFSVQIANSIEQGGGGKVLLSGGGAHNTFFVHQLREKCKAEIVVADETTINFKEAIIFALLGWLRWNNLPNCLSSVTGAKENVCGGVVWGK
jgi:anhydro-N-acetylmuramic acid kinase